MRKLTILLTMLLAATRGMGLTLAVDKRIGIENGLSNNFVLNIVIDGQGYIWAATESGLNRIAGNTCTTVIADNNISALWYDRRSDQMLIGMDGGLTVCDCRTGAMRHLTTDHGLKGSGISHITPVAGQEGKAWLVFSNGQAQQMDCLTCEPSGAGQTQTYSNRCGLDDGKGHLYLGHRTNGMTVIDLKTGQQRHFHHQDGDDQSLPGDNVRRIVQDSRGNLWVGTDHGLARFDPATGRFTKVGNGSAGGGYDDNVFDIREMKDGTLWVASDMGGISVIDLKALQENKTSDIRFDQSVQVALSSLNSRSIAQDEFGNIWIGNHSTGIDFISARAEIFNTLPYYDEGRQTLKRAYGIAADRNGDIWVGDEDEVALFKDNRLAAVWQVGGKKNRSHSFIMCLLPDSKGYVWLGIEDEGVIRFDRSSHRFESIDIGHVAPDIRALHEDRDGTVWIGSEYGVFTYRNGTVNNERLLNDSIKVGAVSSFGETSDGQVVIGTLSRGAYILSRDRRSVKSLTAGNGLPSQQVEHIFIDRKQGLWIGTKKGLVYLPNINDIENLGTFGKAHGLNDPHIRAIQQDSSGRIWVSTYTGIACLNLQKKHFYNYSHISHMPAGSFVAGSAATLADGTIYFGSPNGVCYFNPQQQNDDMKVSDVQMVFCEAYNPAGQDTEILRLVADKNNCVHTNYKQNTLHMAFTVRDYAQADNVEYSYKMKGMNDKWYYIDNDHDIVFRGLQPGKYTFILRAKLKNQDWENASVTQFDILISPPLWRTWWAYLLYLLLLAAAGWYLLTSYKRRLQLQTSLELQRRDSLHEQELNEERMHFFTNITHELRAPLDLILKPLDELAGDPQLSQEHQTKLQLIGKSARQLRDLINKVLEFRQTESQNKKLEATLGDLKALVKETGQYFKQMNRNPKVSVHVMVRPDIPPLYFDAEVVTSILNNLLSNAMKYTEQGSVNLIMLMDEERNLVKISVKDTGSGIDREALPHIFERYYQGKGKRQDGGTGIGLALAKSLADLHEGTLTVESRQGEGSVFTFSLRIDNTYGHDNAQSTESTHGHDGIEASAHSSEASAHSTEASGNSAEASAPEQHA